MNILLMENNIKNSIFDDEMKISMLMNESNMFMNNICKNEILNESINFNSIKEAIIKFFKFIRDKIKTAIETILNKLKSFKKNIKENRLKFLINKIKNKKKLNEQEQEQIKIKIPQIYDYAINFFRNSYKDKEINLGTIPAFGVNFLGICTEYFGFIDKNVNKCINLDITKYDNDDINKFIIDIKNEIEEKSLNIITSVDDKSPITSLRKDIVDYFLNTADKYQITTKNINKYYKELIKIIDRDDDIAEIKSIHSNINKKIDEYKNDLIQKINSSGDEKYNYYFNNYTNLIEYITLSEINVTNSISEIFAYMTIESSKILENLVLKFVELSNYDFI